MIKYLLFIEIEGRLSLQAKQRLQSEYPPGLPIFKTGSTNIEKTLHSNVVEIL
jgi:hypothetical protein